MDPLLQDFIVNQKIELDQNQLTLQNYLLQRGEKNENKDIFIDDVKKRK